MIVLLMGTGLLLTVRTGAVQIWYLGFALREVLGKLTQRGGGPGNVTPFQAVATALASTVGVGNIAGVSTAIFLGSYYGETGFVYLAGPRAAVPYGLAWLVFVYLGSTGSLHLVWDIADTLNGLMAIPNLVAILASMPVLLRLQREFFAKVR